MHTQGISAGLPPSRLAQLPELGAAGTLAAQADPGPGRGGQAVGAFRLVQAPVLRPRSSQVQPAPPQALTQVLAALAADAPLVRSQPAGLTVRQVADAEAGPPVGAGGVAQAKALQPGQQGEAGQEIGGLDAGLALLPAGPRRG